MTGSGTSPWPPRRVARRCERRGGNADARAANYGRLFGMMLCAQQDHLVDVLATHFPGTGPAVRGIAYHVADDMDGTGTAACGQRPMGASNADAS